MSRVGKLKPCQMVQFLQFWSFYFTGSRWPVGDARQRLWLEQGPAHGYQSNNTDASEENRAFRYLLSRKVTNHVLWEVVLVRVLRRSRTNKRWGGWQDPRPAGGFGKLVIQASFPKWLYHSTLPPVRSEDPVFPTSLPSLGNVGLFNFSFFVVAKKWWTHGWFNL